VGFLDDLSIPGNDGGGWQGQLSDVLRGGVELYGAIRDVGVQRKLQRQARKPGGGGLGMGFAMPGSYGGRGNTGLVNNDFPRSPLGQLLGFGESTSTAQSGCFKISSPNAQRVTPCKAIRATGPDGQCYEWVYRGRPVLYSGDVAAAKRTHKLLSRFGRKLGKRPR
jgi:hypothetical protein